MRVIAGDAKGVRLGPVPPGTQARFRHGARGVVREPRPRCDGCSGPRPVRGDGRARDRGALAWRRLGDVRGASREGRRCDPGESRADQARGPGRGGAGRCRPMVDGIPCHPSEFDLVTLDPPYDVSGPPLEDALAALDRGWLAGQGWTVVLTRGHKSSMPVVPVHWAVRRQLRYGDSLLTLYREERWA